MIKFNIFKKKTKIKAKSGQKPLQHIAIIMDGNGRWAQKRGLPRVFGHRESVKRLKEIFRYCKENNIPYLTLFAFSTENWLRPVEEVNFLMDLLCETIEKELPELTKNNIKLNFIGDLGKLPPKVQTMIKIAQEVTITPDLTVNIALNYGGRDEIVRACRKLLKDPPKNLTEEEFARHLDLYAQPDPDLLIRTSGEQRLSNFLLWQLAYAEFYFTPVFWPDFTRNELEKAVAAFYKRNRRFGGI